MRRVISIKFNKDRRAIVERARCYVSHSPDDYMFLWEYANKRYKRITVEGKWVKFYL